MAARSRRHNKDQPLVLDAKDIPSLAKFIKSDACKNIILMLGAGVSTSAGIPDFRSPKTGLYSNLQRLNLPYPEAVFDIGFFRRNPVPFYTLAHELYPGKFRPTITHSFIKLLENKGLLHTCFTQNIDTLERRAGVSEAKIIEAHGSFASQRCIDCQTEFDSESMKKHVYEKTIAKCKSCGGLVKPDIVFFGEGLPRSFTKSVMNVSKGDLLIVMGTSLTVHPFASLAGIPDEFCPRVLINLEKVGDFGTRRDDVLLLGKCDDAVRELCQALGWEDELMKLWDKTKYSVETSEYDVEGVEVAPAEENEEELLEKEIEAVTAAIEQSLMLKAEAIAAGQTDKVRASTADKDKDESTEASQIPSETSTSASNEGDSLTEPEEGTSATTRETPVTTEETTATTAETPVTTEETTATKEETPATKDETPATKEDTPATNEETPAITKDQPSLPDTEKAEKPQEPEPTLAQPTALAAVESKKDDEAKPEEVKL